MSFYCYLIYFYSSFETTLLNSLKDFLLSHVTYEDLYKNIASFTAASLGIESSWEPSVKKEIEDFSITLGASIEKLFLEIPPKSLVKLPKEVFQKNETIEKLFLDKFKEYYEDNKRVLDCETFWKLIDRFLGNKSNHLYCNNIIQPCTFLQKK